MASARPKIFEPRIVVYDRPVHPEFFRILVSRTRRCGEYEIFFAVTNVGHVLSWTDGSRTWTEIIASKIDELPENPLFDQSLVVSAKPSIYLSRRNDYRNSCRIEEVSTEFFGVFENELIRNLEPEGLLHRFGFSGRLTLGAIGYIGLETRSNRLTVQAVHTFPDDGVFLRTESEIRR